MRPNSIAILQPYFFPYLPYFQLIASVEKVVFLDDVSMGKRSFNTKNKIANKKGEQIDFGLSVIEKSRNKTFQESEYLINGETIVKKLYHTYSKAKNFKDVNQILLDTINYLPRNVGIVNIKGITDILKYLRITTKTFKSSEIGLVNHQDASNRLINICKYFDSNFYVNPIGGKDLYSSQHFLEHGVHIEFFSAETIYYTQFSNSKFIPYLSVLDFLVHNLREEIDDKKIFLKY